jgi:ATP-dependent helicase HepA
LAWNNFSGGSQRLIKLIEYLKLRSKESPLPKLIIFAGFPGIALPLAQELSLHLGKGSITEFRSELSREEKEENVSRFQNNHRTFVMVCDETGGEGRNFQFASEIVHFDMPWHVGRIEQRIGRIDRLGREKVRQDAVSIVFYNEHSVEAGLFHCYLSGFQVYNKSISGLEFALRDLEKEVVAMAIDKGRDGLMDFIPKLSSLTEQERDQDESQALSDLASFNRSAADRFQKVLQSEASELMLEEAFINYFRMITTHNSVKEIHDSIFPQAIWQFSLDNTVYGALPLKDKNQEGLFGTCQGTFRREVARQRPQLNFFNVGNPVFDAVLSSLKLHSTGRVYALDCKSHEAIRWAGFEFVFGVSFDLEDIPNHWGMANQARSIFTVMPFHLFFKINGQYESSSDSLLKIRQSLRIADKGKTWGNLTKDKVAILPNLVEDANWQNVLLKTYEKAEYKAREHFNARLEREVREETKRLEEMLEKIRGQEGSFGKIEIQAIAGLLAAIPNWRVELDAIGFLGINLGLREG